MAAANGQTQNTPVKKGLAPQQRNLFIGLGAVGLLALIGGGLYFGGVIGGGSEPETTVATNTATAQTGAAGALPTETGAGGASSAAGIDPATGLAPVAAAAPTSGVAQPLGKFRSDPFQQAYFIPTPVPTLPPPPPPVPLPSPSEVEPIAIPGIPGGNAELQRPLNLPPVRISRLDEGLRRPSGAFPPRRTLGGAGEGGAGVPEQSYDKRLSGVVIADGVRAILEIQGPTGRTSRVVQPGDEVDGITVLNIQRFNDGARTVTRMLIRENGEERIVELRAGVPVGPPPGAGGEGGLGGEGVLGGL